MGIKTVVFFCLFAVVLNMAQVHAVPYWSRYNPWYGVPNSNSNVNDNENYNTNNNANSLESQAYNGGFGYDDCQPYYDRWSWQFVPAQCRNYAY